MPANRVFMNVDHKLAIIIPAYKISYFRQSIESVANQTCKDFTLYIGEDASPHNFTEIVNFYRDKINIVYQRFEKNLGGEDLVGHWNRCINMIQKEEWIWLFSDDDIMGDNCVQRFYEHIENNDGNSLLHFNLQVINEKSLNIFKIRKFASHYSTEQYFSAVLNRKVDSTVVEYIFNRQLFKRVNGFQSFDLAWSSDTATWIKLSVFGGICTIEDAIVKWRFSTLNISSMSADRTFVLRKVQAGVAYLKWGSQFFEENNLVDNTSGIEKARWLLICIVYTPALSVKEKYKLIIDSLNSLNLEKLRSQVLIIWLFEELKKKFKAAIFYK